MRKIEHFAQICEDTINLNRMRKSLQIFTSAKKNHTTLESVKKTDSKAFSGCCHYSERKIHQLNWLDCFSQQERITMPGYLSLVTPISPRACMYTKFILNALQVIQSRLIKCFLFMLDKVDKEAAFLFLLVDECCERHAVTCFGAYAMRIQAYQIS